MLEDLFIKGNSAKENTSNKYPFNDFYHLASDDRGLHMTIFDPLQEKMKS